MTPHFWPKNDKNAQGSTSRKIGWGCAACFLNSLPYFRPKSVIFPTLFQTWSPGARRVTRARDKLLRHIHQYTVAGVNIKREMVLLPNDEEVANSSKKHTQFKTRVHKPYPIWDQNGRNWYPFSDQNGWKEHILWRRTYPCSLCKGLPPLPPPPARSEKRVADYESRCLRKRD